MKRTILSLYFLTLVVVIGCQKPCSKTITLPGYRGDTVYLKRTYTNCNDTLNYYEWKVKKDSTVIVEGEVLNGKKEGDWKFSGWRNRVITYSGGIEVLLKWFHENGNLEQEEKLNGDSLFEVCSFYEDGTLESEGFQTLDGFKIGHGIAYDTLGRKSAEGDYIAEPCLTDTVYIESPESPYDLQMTIIEELGGKHGPWVNYDSVGNMIDTTWFDYGVPVGHKRREKKLKVEERDEARSEVPMIEPANKPEPIAEEVREFEGRITYKVTEQYAIIRGEGWNITSPGTKREVFYNKGQWLEKGNGKHFRWRLYFPSENRVYMAHQFVDEQFIVWTHGGFIQDFHSVKRVEVNEKAETILGRLCDQVILYGEGDTAEYFFSHDFPLNYRHFEKC